jgi:DNA-binding cell septation regulator SpoVG
MLFNSLVIRGLRIVNGKNGIFVGMPREMGKDGKWYHTIQTTNRDVKKAIDETVLGAYAQ